MKKFKYLLMAIIAVTFSFSFSACGDDNNDEPQTDPVRTSKIAYSLTVTDDVFSAADITINYIGMDGVEHSEAMTNKTWSKTFSQNKFGVSAGVSVSMKLKDGVELTKETYRVGYSFSFTAESTENGKVIASQGSPRSSEMTISAANVEEYLKRKSFRAALKIDAEGKISDTELPWQNNGNFEDLPLIQFI